MRTRTIAGALAAVALAGLAACGGGEPAEDGAGEALSGRVSIDGSSTVLPVSEAMAEEFMREHRGVQVTVGVSGTGGGFKKFCAGETDISNASRTLKDSEREACRSAGITPLEIPVALDGIAVAVNPANDWVRCLTVDELRRTWQPGSTVGSWSQIRDGFPDRELILYGPDTDSGTFDYFTEAVVGEEDASRSDYTASADDNVLVIGVEGDEGALGYFGYAYLEENRSRLKAVAVDGGEGCVEPTPENIESGTYQPLSRPLFIYVKESALARPEVDAFVAFYLENATALVPEVGYVPLSADRYREQMGRVEAAAGNPAGGSGAGEGEGEGG